MRYNRSKSRGFLLTIIFILLIAVIVFLCFAKWKSSEEYRKQTAEFIAPEYEGAPYAVINNNKPYFDEEDINTNAFESYSDLDYLGRCGVAYANISRELMPTEERGEIGSIKPSGWKQAKYEGYVNSKPPYLYNRCHLIAYCLTAENANEKNLITGTRYMNVEGMLPFEEQVARYLDNSDSYRLCKIFLEHNIYGNYK